MKVFAGIDYGSKLAGTTVICQMQHNRLLFSQSTKKKDADEWLSKELQQLAPELVFLDAPLSLPGVYRDLPNCSDYFYRKADKELKAMSPMFLGGLTARAMRLRALLENELNCSIVEVYPGYLARELKLKDGGYKKEKENIASLLEVIAPLLPYELRTPPQNWHQFDALLAWLSGWRYLHRRHFTFGSMPEGQIIV